MNQNFIDTKESQQSDSYNLTFDEILFFFRRYWRIFLFSFLIFLLTAFLVNRFSTRLFIAETKIKILDKKENNLSLPSVEDLFSSSKINLENDIEILQSTPIINKVIEKLNMTYKFFGNGEVKSDHITSFPFDFNLLVEPESITEHNYNINFTVNGIEITLVKDRIEKEYKFDGFNTNLTSHDLPFQISNYNKDLDNFLDYESYSLIFYDKSDIIYEIQNNLTISKIGQKSDIISLRYRYKNRYLVVDFLNELVKVFNNDGVSDRQLIHKRTVEFVNNRFLTLSKELDSIEINKQDYKSKNDIVSFESNAIISLEKTSSSRSQLYLIENEISITKFLQESLNNVDFDLLPSNIGINNERINLLIADFNTTIIDRKKIILSAGINNPIVKQFDDLIVDVKNNISLTITTHLERLEINLKNLTSQYQTFENNVANLPENEKILRSIERNQQIKEALYLILLQKREEAEVSYAVTEPSVKVVEYATLNKDIDWPKTSLLYALFIIISFIIPLFWLYILRSRDRSIHSKEDLKSAQLFDYVVGDIPFYDDIEDKIFNNPTSRTNASESSRMIVSNLKYLLDIDEKCPIILTTSSVKAEGKTLTALNTSLALASIGKKVLLIGADMRNPQIHQYIGMDKNVNGLADFLVNNKLRWQDFLCSYSDNFPSHKILLSGSIPPNPHTLINNGNFQILLKQAQEEFDYVLIDSAPTILVADTLSIMNLASVVLYIVRCEVTDKTILQYIRRLIDDKKINNLAIAVNSVGRQDKYGYNYSYTYGYKYGYNYGYGYGYGDGD